VLSRALQGVRLRVSAWDAHLVNCVRRGLLLCQNLAALSKESVTSLRGDRQNSECMKPFASLLVALVALPGFKITAPTEP
jgi:hypothetical protein